MSKGLCFHPENKEKVQLYVKSNLVRVGTIDISWMSEVESAKSKRNLGRPNAFICDDLRFRY